MAADVGGGDLDLVEQPLVDRQLADEGDDGRCVAGGAGPDAEGGLRHQAAAMSSSISV